MEWSDRGLVLARGVFREYDVWLRILFRQHGVQTVFAFGGQHSRRRFVGCLDLLNLLDCHVQEKGSYCCMTEAVLVRGPGALRARPGRQGLAMNFLRLTDSAAVTAEQSPAVLTLLEESLDLLSRDQLPDTMSLFFRLRLMAVLGYAPDFLRCCLCRRPLAGKSFFCVEEGGPMCESCRSRYGGRRQSGAWLQYPTLQLLQKVRASDPLSWPVPGMQAACTACGAAAQDPGSADQTDAAARLSGSQGADIPFDRTLPGTTVCGQQAVPPGGSGTGSRTASAPGAPWLDSAQRRAASLCIDGMLAYHVGLAWEKGRYVRT